MCKNKKGGSGMRKILLILLISFLIFPTLLAREIVLSWTAPADDVGKPTEGPVAYYKLVYSNIPITEVNFHDATQLTTNIPLSPGVAESYTYDLPDDEHYYYAIKSYDAAGNESPISNIAEKDFLSPSPITDLSS